MPQVIRLLISSMFLLNLLPLFLIRFLPVDYYPLLSIAGLPIILVCLNRALMIKKGKHAFLIHYVLSLMIVLLSSVLGFIHWELYPDNEFNPTRPLILLGYMIMAASVVSVTILSGYAHHYIKPKIPNNQQGSDAPCSDSQSDSSITRSC